MEGHGEPVLELRLRRGHGGRRLALVGRYFCGPAVAATKKGISYILKDSTDGLTKSFYKKARKAANAAGVNDYGKMVEVDIEDSCDYTFPTAGV